MPAIKTANVNARIDQNIKSQAEAILTRMGLPRSVAIDVFYRQIIMHGGLPFPLTIPSSELPARDEMTDEEFNRIMATGLKQAKANDSFDLEEVFDELEAGLEG
jgi:addiction module RelB/DinJ family antitoxin